jgi:hypothetical protein
MNNKDLAQEWFSMGDLDIDSAVFLQSMKSFVITASNVQKNI